jgi:hypothetical protein
MTKDGGGAESNGGVGGSSRGGCAAETNEAIHFAPAVYVTPDSIAL